MISRVPGAMLIGAVDATRPLLPEGPRGRTEGSAPRSELTSDVRVPDVYPFLVEPAQSGWRLRVHGDTQSTYRKGSTVASYYWTTQPETPAVYHNNASCPEGLKIKPEHKATGSTPPAGRRLCEKC